MPETAQFGETEDAFIEGALAANTILMARYKVLGLLGGGGQGAVYQGRDLNFPEAKRLVAIKEMHYPSNDPSVRSVTLSTFQREANILATLSHPAIPRIYDFFDQNSRAYLVMEYINGSDLELLLTKTKTLPLNKILEWAIDLCDVLYYLHSHQPEPIIFRDIKPANVMIDHLGKARLIDFGIAKIFATGVKHTMIGTEGYSAPEQYKGDVNPSSDIYALGATLHHILSRKDPRLEPPFSFNERPLKQFNPEVSDALAEIVDKALAMDSKDRFPTCLQMKEALEQVRYRPTATTRKVGTGPVDPFDGGTTVFEDEEEEMVVGAIQPRWTFKTEDEIRSAPNTWKNLVFVGSYDTNVWALNIENGDLRWKYPTGAGIATTPAVDEFSNLVVFGSEDFSLYAVEASSGQIMWSYATNDRIRSSPTIAQDHVFFGGDDGRVHSLISGNGRHLWEYDAGAPVRSKPYVTDELIIIGTEMGELMGLELGGGRKWTYRASKRALTASPIVDEIENVCYVGAFDGYMYAHDANTGYSMWRFRTTGPIISSVVVDSATVYFGSTDGNFYAVNATNAKEKWRFTVEKPIVGSPVIHKGRIYFGGTDGILYCLEAKTGRELWRFKTGASITSAPYITEDYIFVGSMDQTIYALPLVSAS